MAPHHASHVDRLAAPRSVTVVVLNLSPLPVNLGIEVPLEGNLIYMRNLDVPGVVGKVGSILGRGKVNIANLALGRSSDKIGADAIAVVQVDSPAPESVLQEIRQLPEIQEVQGIRL